MTGALLASIPRRVRAAPALTVLPVAVIALGSAAVLSVQLLNRAALGALDASLDAVSPGADLRVEGVVVGSGSVPDAAWPRVLRVPGVAAVTPLVRLAGVTAASEERSVPLLLWGVDAFSGSSFFRAGAAEPDGGPDGAVPDTFFAGGVVLPRTAGEALGLGAGDPVRVVRGDRTLTAPVAALLGEDGAGEAGFLDIAFAQELAGRPGLDRLEVRIRPGADREAVAAGIAAAVPGVRAVTREVLREEGADLFGAFRMNLTALSAVSLLVGAFLVAASVRAALVLRRREIGLYRALGAPAGSVLRLLVLEVVAIGTLGALVGVPFGALAASASLDLVEFMVRNFYLLERIEAVSLDPGAVALAVAVALLAALAGALPEVIAEVRRPPARLLLPGRGAGAARDEGRGWRRAAPAVLGLLLVGFAAWAVWLPDGVGAGLGGGFAAGGALLVGAALLPAACLGALRPAAARWGRGPAFWRGAAAAIREPASTAPPAAALVIAVAMLVGMSALIGSFRSTLDAWLGQTLVADIYVSRFGDPRRSLARRSALDPDTVARLAGAPEVAEADLVRALRVRLEGRPVPVFGIRPDLPRIAERFAFVGAPDRPMEALAAGAVLVSEPLARRLNLEVGDALPLPGSWVPGDGSLGDGLPAAVVEPGTGPAAHRARIAGIYRDYGNENGALFLDRRLVNRLYPAEPPAVPPSGVLQQAGRGAGTDDGAPVHGVALYLEPGSNAAAVAARLERELSGDLEIVPNHRLRERALAVFDQTMAVTGLLEVFALAIAAIGIALSLWTLARERSAESALLRALGESRRQVAAGFLGRGALIGGLALALGGGTGAILTLLLVRVVNPLWFGWSLDLHWPVGSLAGEGAVVVLVGVLAAALPARLASRTGAAALVEEV